MEAVSKLERTIEILRVLPERQLDMIYSYAQFVSGQEDEARDPFYAEGNRRYLERKMEEYKAGRLRFAEHGLVEG